MIVTLNQILLGASLDLGLKVVRTFRLLGSSAKGLVKCFFLRERVLVLVLAFLALGEDVVILVVVAVLFEFVFLLGFRGRFARGRR